MGLYRDKDRIIPWWEQVGLTSQAASRLPEVVVDAFNRLLRRIAILDEMSDIGAQCVYGESEGLWMEPGGREPDRFRELEQSLDTLNKE